MLALLLASPAALAWGHHYMVTDQALSHASLAWLDAPVQVRSLDSLLDQAGPQLSQAIDAHYAWMLSRGSERFSRQRLPADATRADFWRAARLNPSAGAPLVQRILPGAQAGPLEVAPEAASPYLHNSGGLLATVALTRAGTEISARAVLHTFVDEPDWGFDHELWPITAYGYGEQPYGKPIGESSKAPFHMQFDHENVLTKAFSDADEGMVHERVDLFLRLSRAAFGADQDYWGLRFAAWATHYAQDLAQPYHSKAIPGVKFGWYLGYVASSKKDAISDEITQIEANRHFVYEDFVATALQRSYTDSDATAQALAGFLAGQGEAFDDVGGGSDLIAVITTTAARHAWTIDQALVAAFPAELMNNADYDVETAPDYDISALVPNVPADAAATLLAETGADFSQAGRATRSVLELVGAQAALQ